MLNTFLKASMTTCENPECGNEVGLNSRGTQYLRYCSPRCRARCNSINGSEKRKRTCLDKFGSTTNLVTDATIEKIKQTNIEKYGVDHPMKSEACKQAVAATKKIKYGDEAYNNREKFRQTVAGFSSEEKQKITQKRVETNLSKYGAEHILNTEYFKEASRATSLAKYGTEFPSSSAVVKEKISSTMRSNYGRHYSQIHMTDEAIQYLSDVVYLENNKHRSAVELASELGVTYYSVIYAYEKYSIERTFDGYNKSLAEKEIADFVRRIS